MLDRIFDLDNPVMRALSALFDLMVLNLITLVLCLPVITAVPALTALHYVTLKMARKEDSYIIKPYFKSFASNFRQAFVLGLILLAAALVIYVDISMIWDSANGFPQSMRIVISGLTIMVVMLLSWVIPMQAHFVNTIRGTLRNSVLMALGNFPRTLAIVGIWLIPIIAALLSYALWPILLMFGLSVPALLSAMVYSPAFRRFEPDPEEETADEMFSMDEAGLDAFSRDLHEIYGDTGNAQNTDAQDDNA